MSVLAAAGIAAWARRSRAGRAGSSSSGWSWPTAAAEPTMPPAGGRIEMADLKERVRKLEAIAAGIDI